MILIVRQVVLSRAGQNFWKRGVLCLPCADSSATDGILPSYVHAALNSDSTTGSRFPLLFQDTITDGKMLVLVTASALFEAGEFIIDAVGVVSYIDVTSQFSGMYSQMNRAAGAGAASSQTCISSCFLPPQHRSPMSVLCALSGFWCFMSVSAVETGNSIKKLILK